jgi:hypothetical protein
MSEGVDHTYLVIFIGWMAALLYLAWSDRRSRP